MAKISFLGLGGLDEKEKSCADKTEHGYPIILSHAAFGRLRLSAAPQHSYDL